jgi:hypothetical protein
MHREEMEALSEQLESRLAETCSAWFRERQVAGKAFDEDVFHVAVTAFIHRTMVLMITPPYPDLVPKEARLKMVDVLRQTIEEYSP